MPLVLLTLGMNPLPLYSIHHVFTCIILCISHISQHHYVKKIYNYVSHGRSRIDITCSQTATKDGIQSVICYPPAPPAVYLPSTRPHIQYIYPPPDHTPSIFICIIMSKKYKCVSHMSFENINYMCSQTATNERLHAYNNISQINIDNILFVQTHLP